MKHALLVVLLVAVTVLPHVEAQQAQKGPYQILGAGAVSCGQWVQQRRTSEWFTLGQWMLGWFSAAGYFNVDMRRTDQAAIMAWVDNYCRAHPLNDLSDAAMQLVNELRLK